MLLRLKKKDASIRQTHAALGVMKRLLLGRISHIKWPEFVLQTAWLGQQVRQVGDSGGQTWVHTPS